MANSTEVPPGFTYDYGVLNLDRPTHAEEQYWEDALSKFIYAVPSLFLLLVGTIGNTLSFLVFNKKSMRKSVTSMYFRVLSITDTTVLYSGCLVNFATGAFSKDARQYADGYCKFFVTLLKTTCYNSCWILVLISIDRFIGVYMPHKYRQYCTKRRAVIAMVIVLMFMVGFVGGFWGTALMVEHHRCGIAARHLVFFNDVYQWLDLLVLNLVPTVILASTNVSIVYKLSKGSFGGDDSTSNSSNAAGKAKQKGNNLTVIMVTVSVVYILCTIPTSTAFLVIRTFHGPRRDAQILLYLRSCETLYYANHGANFFLYCIHGTTFRKELKGLCCKSDRPTSSVSNSTNMSAYTVSQTDNNAQMQD